MNRSTECRMKMDEAGYEYVDWLEVPEGRFQWQALVT
jgi:hypothetical protein